MTYHSSLRTYYNKKVFMLLPVLFLLRKENQLPREVNPCAKTVKPEQAYEVYQTLDGAFTYYVLRKYQTPTKEAQNPYARWYCMVVSPACPKGEYGDAYRL